LQKNRCFWQSWFSKLCHKSIFKNRNVLFFAKKIWSFCYNHLQKVQVTISTPSTFKKSKINRSRFGQLLISSITHRSFCSFQKSNCVIACSYALKKSKLAIALLLLFAKEQKSNCYLCRSFEKSNKTSDCSFVLFKRVS